MSITIEVVVRATGEQEALEIGASEWIEEPTSPDDFDVKPMQALPGSWAEDSLVYGHHDGNLTVAQCVDAGEAPKYSEQLALFAARKVVQP